MRDDRPLDVARAFARKIREFLARRGRNAFPFTPHFPVEARTSMPRVERLSDEQLRNLNRVLDWNCYLLDSKGRRFGNIARTGKRVRPEKVPDPRIVLLDRRFGLQGRTVLEFGCFEGIHTVALCALGASVTAVDARIDHVAKTLLRCAMLGHSPEVFLCNLEDPNECKSLPRVEILHHVGVLYHLTDPVGHLCMLQNLSSVGLMLDTHYAPETRVTETYQSADGFYAFMRHQEGGRGEAFSGMEPFSRWLTLGTICNLLERNGFTGIEVHESRDERNGPRALIFARRRIEPIVRAE